MTKLTGLSRLIARLCILGILITALVLSTEPSEVRADCPAGVPCPELWECNPNSYGCHCVSFECCLYYNSSTPECCATVYPNGDGSGPCPDPE